MLPICKNQRPLIRGHERSMFIMFRPLIAVLLLLVFASCTSTPEKPGVKSQTQPVVTKNEEQAKLPEISPSTEPVIDSSRWSSAAKKLFSQGVAAIKKDPVRAKDYFMQAIKLAPTMEPAYVNVVKLDIQNKKLTNLDSLKKDAEQQHVTTARLLNLFGLAERMKGEFKVSKSSYSRAIKLNNSYLPAILNMAILQDVYIGDLLSAQKYYRMYQQGMLAQGKKDKNLKNWLADLKQRLKHYQPSKAVQEDSGSKNQ